MKFTNEYTIEDLGVQEQFVYDIGVEDNNNFFANNILVHNSNYINLGDYCKKFNLTNVDEIDNTIVKEIESNIEKWYDEIFKKMNHFENHMVMKREVIADKGLFLNKKKRYALSVIDNEGVRYNEPHLKIIGLSVKKSSTPRIIKPMLEEVIKIILYKDNMALVKYVNECKKKFNDMNYIDISPMYSINNIEKYQTYDRGKLTYKLGTPFGQKSAINHNRYILEHNIDMALITSGDKYHITYLKPVNPLNTGETVIAFKDKLPKELESYVDYEVLFEKTFTKAIETITDDLGFKLKMSASIEDLF